MFEPLPVSTKPSSKEDLLSWLSAWNRARDRAAFAVAKLLEARQSRSDKWNAARIAANNQRFQDWKWQPSCPMPAITVVRTQPITPAPMHMAAIDFADDIAERKTIVNLPAIRLPKPEPLTPLPVQTEEPRDMITQVEANLLMASPRVTNPIPVVELVTYTDTTKSYTKTFPPRTSLREMLRETVEECHDAYRSYPGLILFHQDHHKLELPFLSEFKRGFITDNPAVSPIPFGIDNSLGLWKIVCLTF